MSRAPFPIDPVLTAITLAYRNKELIADAVLPRLPSIPKETFKYTVWDLAEGFTMPDTLVGRKSMPNEVEFSATEVNGSTDDYGLDDVIPNKDIENAGPDVDVVSRATETLSELIALGREIRVSNLVFTAANYPAGNQVTLSGANQWSDPTSDPIGDIVTALDTPIVRPNIGVFGQLTWSTLTQHPKIVKATNRNSGDAGIAARQAVAELFELSEIQVGAGFLNTAKKGQAVTMARVWGKHASFLRINPLATRPNGNEITFGFTVPFGDRTSGSMPEPKIGLRGSERVRVGESVKELISANDVGYFIEDAIA